MKPISIRLGNILRGTHITMKQFLEKTVPSNACILFEEEPYDTIQTEDALQAFSLLLKDPRLIVDDLFLARQLYFSSGPSRDIVLLHPKCFAIVRARPRFMDYFYERYGSRAAYTHVGMLQRYGRAELILRKWKNQRTMRLVFQFYPALIRYIRRFKEDYYAPGGPGYLAAKRRFELQGV